MTSMFEVMSLRRPSVAAPSEDSTNHLSFPHYLLPSLRIPFRRYRIPEPARSPATSPSEPPSPTSSRSSTTPSLSSSPVTSPSTPNRRLSRTHPSTLRCSTCSTDVAFSSQIVSKCFTGRHGRAYLVAPPPANPPSPSTSSPAKNTTAADNATGDLINIRVGPGERRRLVTGAHVVADISCASCNALIGWKYLEAQEPGQRYKVGMFILETRKVVGFHSWEDVDDAEWELSGVNDGVDKASRSSVFGEGWVGKDHGDDEGEDGVVVFDSDDEDECEDIFAGVWDAEVVAHRRRSRRQ